MNNYSCLLFNAPWSYVINRILFSTVPVIIWEPVEGKLSKSALTFVSGLQAIPAPSGASSINVPTHVPLLCTVPIYIHLLRMCAPTSVCGVHGHPYIFFHFSPTYSAQSLPVLIAVLLFKILSLSRLHIFLIFFLNTPPIFLSSGCNVFTAPLLCIQISVLYVKRVK